MSGDGGGGGRRVVKGAMAAAGMARRGMLGLSMGCYDVRLIDTGRKDMK